MNYNHLAVTAVELSSATETKTLTIGQFGVKADLPSPCLAGSMLIYWRTTLQKIAKANFEEMGMEYMSIFPSY